MAAAAPRPEGGALIVERRAFKIKVKQERDTGKPIAFGDYTQTERAHVILMGDLPPNTPSYTTLDPNNPSRTISEMISSHQCLRGGKSAVLDFSFLLWRAEIARVVSLFFLHSCQESSQQFVFLLSSCAIRSDAMACIFL